MAEGGAPHTRAERRPWMRRVRRAPAMGEGRRPGPSAGLMAGRTGGQGVWAPGTDHSRAGSRDGRPGCGSRDG